MSILEITPELSETAAIGEDATESDAPAGSPTEPESPAGDVPAGMGTRPTFTITEAATACSVSRKTITRKLPDLAVHGAAKDDDGVWRIPVEALLAVGLHPGRSLPTSTPRAKAAAVPGSSAPSPVAAPSPGPGAATRQQPVASVGTAANLMADTVDTVTVSRDRWDDLRLRLARAEAEAAERSLALADARLALRALTAVPHTPTPPAAPVQTVSSPQPNPAGHQALAPKKRRWWQAS